MNNDDDDQLRSPFLPREWFAHCQNIYKHYMATSHCFKPKLNVPFLICVCGFFSNDNDSQYTWIYLIRWNVKGLQQSGNTHTHTHTLLGTSTW